MTPSSSGNRMASQMRSLFHPKWNYQLTPRDLEDDSKNTSSDLSRQSLEDQDEAEAETLMHGEKMLGLRKSASTSVRWYWWSSLVCNIILLIVSGILYTQVFKSLNLNEQKCTAMVSATSPALGSVEYEMVKFQGGLDAVNPYKGYPSPELDEAWETMVNLGRVRVSEEDFDKLGKDKKGSVRYPDGTFQGGLEVFHQLHCINFIRQSSYRDYYEKEGNRPEAFHDSLKTQRLHLDHCIDSLRQAITCHGDIGIVTANWVEGRAGPYPDFSTWHKCRKLEPLSRYTDEHPGQVEFKKPADAYALKSPPP